MSGASTPARLQLAAVLDLKAAAPLAQDLIALRGQDLFLSANGVQRLGGQCLQVLLAARQAWRDDGQAMVVEAESEAFANTVSLLGAASLLMEQPGDAF